MRKIRDHFIKNTRVLYVNCRPHVGVDVTMIGKAAGGRKLEPVGATRGDVSTIKRLTVITGDGMGHGRHVLPDHGRPYRDRHRRRAVVKAPIPLVDDLYDHRGACNRCLPGRWSWSQAAGCRSRRACSSCWCRCGACAGGTATPTPTGGKQHR